MKLLAFYKSEHKGISYYFRKSFSHINPAEQMLHHEEYRKLLRPFLKHDHLNLQSWAHDDYLRSTSHPESLTITTSHGWHVRSKSEALIVSALDKYEIPYRYEERLKIGGMVFHPDFTIRHPHTGDTIYWEHLGRMDDPQYVSDKFTAKICTFAQNDIIAGKNLILTYETSTCPLTPQTIEETIEHYFLRVPYML